MEMNNLTFRPARPADHKVLDTIVADAFGPEDVVTFLSALRRDDLMIGEWVALMGRRIMGHIGFATAQVDTGYTIYDLPMLTPLSVAPDVQGQGIGGALVYHAHRDLMPRYPQTCVLGHPTYYPRHGYVHYSDQPVTCKWAQNTAFMIRGPRPAPGALMISETILNG